LFAERGESGFILRRGFRLEPEARVVIVEDVFTTGKSTREVMDMVGGLGATVVAVGSIVDRGLPDGAFSVPSRSLLSLDVASWPDTECPLCAGGVPLDTPGSRYSAAR
jgi:orotate phosphoribosyltransferase